MSTLTSKLRKGGLQTQYQILKTWGLIFHGMTFQVGVPPFCWTCCSKYLDTLVNLWLLSVSCCPQTLAIRSNALITEKSIDMKIRFGPLSLHRHNQYLSWSPNGNISYYFYELDLFQHQILCISALIKCTHLVWLCPFVYDFYFRYNFKTSLFWIDAGSHKYFQK